ncbi:DegT/DnrJ/EryC1/StrS family aminotransferase [Actinokineospora guangxiensis]|uniref:DegT/DnrJ/EryC1/StrS family aminotransferase n=1 Tax=Actinokineospora guangxiensis TaxID=1490288 RepID=A0ABW0EQX6_9PSEU
MQALRSRRWAVSWPADGTKSRERQFAEEYARYHDVPYCVSVDHGSSALVVALEALDIGPGDEVVVPNLTWVAPVTAVLRVGALPVLADVDPRSGCLTPETAAAAMSERTKAIIVVHLACTVADLDGLCAMAEGAGVPLIEDAAQAHGAQWRGRKVGTFGRIGAFSFQVGKVLAGGEGGAVITSDPEIHLRAQLLRADSRRYADGPVPVAAMELRPDPLVMGTNYCMSELTAGVLLDRLPHLDDENAHRAKMADELSAGLAALDGVGVVPVPDAVDLRSVYEFGVRFEPDTFGGVPVERVAEAVSAELEMAVWAPSTPLHRSHMVRPETKRRFAAVWTESGRRRAVGRDYPGAERYRETTVLFYHRALLGDEHDMADIVAAVGKVLTRRRDLIG